MTVKDKVAIVTGASSGIGMAVSKPLNNKGAKVTLVARSQPKLENLSRVLPGSFVAVCDMAREKDVKLMVGKVYRHYGRIDILINCAGRGYDSLPSGIDIKKYRQLFDLDVVGPPVAMQAVIPLMRKQGRGAIVNISSGASLMALPNMGPYSSLKRALNGLTLTSGAELAKYNIKVSLIYPYITDTDFEKNTLKGKVDYGL